MSTRLDVTSDVPTATPIPGRSLPQQYYTSPEIFALDMQMYGTTQWLYVDHASRIPNPGNWLTYKFGDESVIIVRNRQGQINAFYNVCRHRGSLICTGESGTSRTLTCKYHAWTYDFDGNLKPPRFMPDDFDPAANGLQRCHVQTYADLIFINLSPGEPPRFEDMIGDLRPFLDLHGLDHAKVIKQERWLVEANWKLNIENFFECYHCLSAHPTYTGVHDELKMLAFGAGAGSAGGELAAQYAQKLAVWEKQVRERGMETHMFADDADSEFFRSASRLPIREGCLTETLDGTPASTLMGRFTAFDGGQTGLSFNPTGTLHGNNDFAILFRYTPIAPTKTELVTSWLVDLDATEGHDYDIDKISAVWAVTLGEDKTITENNQAGVMSRTYQPGVYSAQEERVASFTQWYLNRLDEFERRSFTA
ncbi:SRPBCC family protein [Nocardia sp. R6R-6]|uniref:SRPBCC family protein n=1 Tax=Nocardia sp. R6R-6 TaxID=3459303 RepID=UPI00403DC38A